MKTAAIAIVAIAFCLVVSSAMPSERAESIQEAEAPLYEVLEHSGRIARATCDLLSVSTPWGSLNHAACAAHCLTMGKGFRGGRCRDGVCHCRK